MVWAGPDDIYPGVAYINAGERVWLHGCLRYHAWCDISLADGPYRVRGWVPGQVLFIPWQGQNHLLSSYGLWQHFPMSDFVLSIYWGNHYSRFPWYSQRNHFGRHDWRHDRWRWDRRDNWSQSDINRQRAIDEQRRLREQQATGRDRDGLTPLQRQIQLQSERARQLQRQREEQARRGQGSVPTTTMPRPDATQQPRPTALQERISENQEQARQLRQGRQVEDEP